SGRMAAEVLLVDDNSPDGTAAIASSYAEKLEQPSIHIRVIRRSYKMGLSSAILDGMRAAQGDIIVVMDSDLSHPPEAIPKMLEELQNPDCDIVVASRYVKGGSTVDWPFLRKIISKGATKIAQYGLGVDIKDPMSGFFAFRRQILSGVKFDPSG